MMCSRRSLPLLFVLAATVFSSSDAFTPVSQIGGRSLVSKNAGRSPMIKNSVSASATNHKILTRGAASAVSCPNHRDCDRQSLLLHASAASPSEEPSPPRNKIVADSLIENTAYALRRTAWLSWWSQVILTTISAVILLFARSIGMAALESQPGMKAPAGFVIGGTGITISVASIFWTWGGARLSARLLRGKTSRIQAANLLRRAIMVGSTLNLSGMLVTLMGTFVIIGSLATKVLTAGGGLSPFGALGAGANAVAMQTVQPLDILIVQANANTLLSHFVSLFLSLFLVRYVKRLDPPSTED